MTNLLQPTAPPPSDLFSGFYIDLDALVVDVCFEGSFDSPLSYPLVDTFDTEFCEHPELDPALRAMCLVAFLCGVGIWVSPFPYFGG
jgi:hypothetical protein